MKKILCLIIILAMLLSACSNIKQGKTEQICTYDGEKTLSYMTELDKNGSFAFLYVDEKTGGYTVYSAQMNGENEKLLYTAKENAYIYELYADENIIAFYERTLYSNNDERCALKVINAETGEVRTPYEKVIVYSKDDIQSRFLSVENKNVYYVTASYALKETRVMKYTFGEESPVEVTTLPFTENEFTFNHSITCASESGGKIAMACVEKYTAYIAIADAKTGVVEKKKTLPSNVGVVYCTAYDSESGIIALYYSTVSEKGEHVCDSVGFISTLDEAITTVYQFESGGYACRETVTLKNGVLAFNVQNGDTSAGDSLTKAGEIYSGYAFDVESKKGILFEKSFKTCSI